MTRRTPHVERLLAATTGLLVLPLPTLSPAAAEPPRPEPPAVAAPVTSAPFGGLPELPSSTAPATPVRAAATAPADDPSATAAGRAARTTTTVGDAARTPMGLVEATAPPVSAVSPATTAALRSTAGSGAGVAVHRPVAVTTTPDVVPSAPAPERRSVGSVLRILTAGFLLVASGLVAATWWFVRATRPVTGRRTV